jgi:hypothetical protein
MKLLTKLLNTLPESQRRSVSAVVAELLHADIISFENIPTKQRDVKSKIEENLEGPTFKALTAIPGTKIQSTTWKGMQERLFVDLYTIYDQLGRLSGEFSHGTTLNYSSFIGTKAAIAKVIEQLKIYQFLKSHPEFQDVRYFSFNDGRNQSLRRPLANIDASVKKLELAPRSKTRLQTQNVNMRTTSVSVRRIGEGLEGGFSAEFGPSKMLDADPDTFWGEMVLSDAIVRQEYQASWGLHQAHGVLAEIEIDLNRVERVNNFRFLPFAIFPVKIVDLAYKDTPAQDGWETIPDFVISEPTLEYVEYDFHPIHLSVIRITIEQPNYTRQVYHLPEKVVQNIALWEQVLDQSYDRTIHQVQLDDVNAAEIAVDAGALAYLNALDMAGGEMAKESYQLRRTRQLDRENKLLQAQGKIMAKVDPERQTDVSEPIMGERVDDPGDLIEISKYEYTFGAREVELNRVAYRPTGHYSSAKLSPGATVLDVQLETTEQHPRYEDDFGRYRRTSIEYEVEIGPNRRFPILPDNTNGQVQDEHILVDRRTRQGLTRFDLDSTAVTIRKNGVRMLISEYSLDFEDTGTTSGKGLLEITEAAYDPNAAFTISYNATIPSMELSLRNISSTPLLEPEIYTKTDRDNRIQLNYYPYVEYEIINDTGTWIQDAEDEARWRFTPSVTNVTSSDGSYIVFNDLTDIDGVSGADWSSLTGLDDLYFHVPGDSKTYAIQLDSASGATLLDEYEGTTGAELLYEIGEGVGIDGQVFTLGDVFYDPLVVFVNDQKAQNLTDYETLEHPAFVPSDVGKKYQYVHAGRNLYFNQAIDDAQVEVSYRWRTQYLRLNTLLRCNIPVRTEVTPKLGDATLKLKTTRL